MRPEKAAVAPERPTVYYVGSFRFPDGDAAAARVLGIGKALRAAGARVIFGGWEDVGRSRDVQLDGTFRFEDFRYVPQADFRQRQLSPLKRLAGAVFSGRNTLRWLARQSMRPGDVLMIYQGGSWFVSRLRRWCRVRSIRLVLDITEWYAPRQLPGGHFNPVWWDSEIRMRLVNPALGRMIAISSFLERYYLSRGCAVLRVPPLIDLQDPRWLSLERTAAACPPLRLAYAGTPGRKDLLANVLRSLVALREQNETIVLNLFGLTREALEQTDPEAASLLTLLGENVLFHGRLPQSEVPGRLMESHFTVLLRPDARYSRAGFPTKVVESLGAGVPVIANPTGDLALFIRDGREGILLADETPAALAAGLRRLIASGPATWLAMRAAARRRAEISFDYRRHVEPIRQFVLAAGHETRRSA